MMKKADDAVQKFSMVETVDQRPQEPQRPEMKNTTPVPFDVCNMQ